MKLNTILYSSLMAMSFSYAEMADALTFNYGSSRGATLSHENSSGSTELQAWSGIAGPYSAHLSVDGTAWYAGSSGGGGGSGSSCAASGPQWSSVIELNWDGTTKRTITSAQLGGGNGHHAITLTDNGTLLAILLESYNGACSEKLVEYDLATDQVVWVWRTGDHEGSGATKLQRGSSSSDPYHINNIDLDVASNKIIFSAHNTYEVYVVDHSIDSTTAKGTAGDIQWRIGKPSNYGVTGGTQFIATAVHSARFVKPGYPGEGNILFYANKSPYNNNYATGYEFKPIYSLDSKGEWQYELVFSGTNNSTSSTNQGGMDKLFNGNWVVTYTGNSKTAYEFEPSQGSVQDISTAVGTWTSAGSNGIRRYEICTGLLKSANAQADAEASAVYNSYCSTTLTIETQKNKPLDVQYNNGTMSVLNGREGVNYTWALINSRGEILKKGMVKSGTEFQLQIPTGVSFLKLNDSNSNQSFRFTNLEGN